MDMETFDSQAEVQVWLLIYVERTARISSYVKISSTNKKTVIKILAFQLWRPMEF